MSARTSNKTQHAGACDALRAGVCDLASLLVRPVRSLVVREQEKPGGQCPAGSPPQ